MRGESLILGAALAGLLTIFAATPARSAIVFVQRNSTLNASGANCGSPPSCGTTGTVSTGTRSFDPYSASLEYDNPVLGGVESTASQQSSLSPTQILVTNRATGSGYLLSGAESSFTVQFTLTEAEHFTLTGSSSNYYDNGNSTTIHLTGPGTDLSAAWYADNGSINAYRVDASGVLPAGDYTFLVDAAAGGPRTNTMSVANAELDLTPVPLPGTLTLMMSALSLLAVARGRSGLRLHAAQA